MNVNKKKLADIFGVDVRTITAWQSQGLPLVSGGGKGTESVFDTTAAIQWYAQREADIENEKLRKEIEDLRAASESDLQPGTIDYERYRLTKAQADAQELKNAREALSSRRSYLPTSFSEWHRIYQGSLSVSLRHCSVNTLIYHPYILML